MSNSATPFVYDYFVKQTLAKLGYSFDPCNLTDVEVEIAMTIQSTINKIEEERVEKRNKQGRKGR